MSSIIKTLLGKKKNPQSFTSFQSLTEMSVSYSEEKDEKNEKTPLISKQKGQKKTQQTNKKSKTRKKIQQKQSLQTNAIEINKKIQLIIEKGKGKGKVDGNEKDLKLFRTKQKEIISNLYKNLPKQTDLKQENPKLNTKLLNQLNALITPSKENYIRIDADTALDIIGIFIRVLPKTNPKKAKALLQKIGKVLSILTNKKIQTTHENTIKGIEALIVQIGSMKSKDKESNPINESINKTLDFMKSQLHHKCVIEALGNIANARKAPHASNKAFTILMDSFMEIYKKEETTPNLMSIFHKIAQAIKSDNSLGNELQEKAKEQEQKINFPEVYLGRNMNKNLTALKNQIRLSCFLSLIWEKNIDDDSYGRNDSDNIREISLNAIENLQNLKISYQKATNIIGNQFEKMKKINKNLSKRIVNRKNRLGIKNKTSKNSNKS